MCGARTVMQLGVCRGWYHCIYVLSVRYGFTLLGCVTWWLLCVVGCSLWVVFYGCLWREGGGEGGRFLLSRHLINLARKETKKTTDLKTLTGFTTSFYANNPMRSEGR